MENLEGEKLLDKIYQNLYNSQSVQHTRKNSDKREESIKRYMDRLERVHKKANTIHKKDLIKRYYYNKYVIDEKNVDIWYNDPEVVIATQQKGISKWLDYLTDENAKYPMWAKYWAFQGMLRMGTYDENKGVYTKRSARTTAPFLEVNPELIAKCISNVIKLVNKEQLSDEEVDRLIEIESFQKLYTLFEREYKDKLKSIIKSDDGIWVKYNEGSKEDAIRLAASLEGMNTGWCTASEDMAISQICGSSQYPGGDFYVFYTKQDNEYKIPRIAIRLDGNKKIGEIRGIESDQNLEERMIQPLEDKLNEMTFLDEDDVKETMNKIQRLRYLHDIGKKTANNIPLTEEEIVDLYTERFGFGWENDPSVGRIIKSRDSVSDYRSIKDKEKRLKLLRIAATYLPEVEDNEEIILEAADKNYYNILNSASKEIKNNKELVLKLIQEYGHIGELEFVSDELKDDKEVVMAELKNNGDALKFASDRLKDDEEVVLRAIAHNGSSIKYASERIRKDKAISFMAIRRDAYSICYIDDSLKSDEDLNLAAAISDCAVFEEFNPTKLEDDDFMIKAIKENPVGFMYASEKIRANRNIVLEVVEKNGILLEYANDRLKEDEEVVMTAIKNNGHALNYASEKLRNDEDFCLKAISISLEALPFTCKSIREEKALIMRVIEKDPNNYFYLSNEQQRNRDIVLKTLRINGNLLRYVPEELKDDEEIVLEAIKQDGTALIFASKRLQRDINMIATAIITTPFELELLDPSYKKDKDLARMVLKHNGYAINYFDDEIKKDKELCLIAIEQDISAVQSIDMTLQKDKDFMLKVIEKVPDCYYFCNEEIKNDIEIARLAVTKDKSNIYSISKDFFNDKNIILAAIFGDKQYESEEEKAKVFNDNLSVLINMGDNLKEDKDFALSLVSINGEAIEYFSDNVKNDKEIAIAAIKSYPLAYHSISERLKQDEDILLLKKEMDNKKYDFEDDYLDVEELPYPDEFIIPEENEQNPFRYDSVSTYDEIIDALNQLDRRRR